MNRETSIYLDLVRFFASMVVLIGHLSGTRFTDGLFWQFGAFMDDAVIVFFVLSGFVIAYVVKRSKGGIESFAIDRAARIYSVALPAICLAYVLDSIGKYLAPELYSKEWGYQNENQGLQFLSGFLFMNQSWFVSMPVGSMLPYWSLAYEVWYYVLFAAFYFVRGMKRLVVVLLACCIVGPKILVLFPLWMLGYLAYWYSSKRAASPVIGVLLLAGSIIGYACHHLYLREWLQLHASLPLEIFGESFHSRYVVGLLFACHLLGFVWASDFMGKFLTPWETTIRWLAGATFTIYLLHLPVAQFLTTVVVWAPSDWRTRAIMLLGTLTLMFLIAEVTERKKTSWRNFIAQVYALAINRAPEEKRVQL